MKKGDLRRQAILDTAEELFFARGYEETSVQDILDAMGLSKGGFYHHFESKMSVLEEISQRRAEKQYAKLAQELKLSNLSAVNKLNHLFSANNLFEREEPKFVRMVLRVCYEAGDTALMTRQRQVTLDKLTPLVNEIVLQGVREGAFYTRYPGDVGRLLLMLSNDINDETARILVRGLGNPECVISVIDLLNVYRDSVEILLNAPYGSIRLFDMDRVLKACRQAIENFESENGEEG